MKKLLISLLILFCVTQTAHAINNAQQELSQMDKIKITWIIKNIEKTANKREIDKFKTYYSKDFKNWDNFGHSEYFSMLEETFNSYSSIKYNIDVKDIQKTKNGLVEVHLEDKTTAIVKEPKENFSNGHLRGMSEYYLYFKKDPLYGWQVIKDKVVNETTFLTYGEATNSFIELNAPESIKPDEEYTIGLTVQPLSKVFVIAALGNEKIVNPPEGSQPIFRKLPPDGILERIVRSNKIGKHEYAMASIGFTRANVADDFSSVSFRMSGLAFVLKRINMNMLAENEVK
ncbi:hypothetical protein IKA15_02825 [bacterium]|nr:hypothetical protein [bacterium]